MDTTKFSIGIIALSLVIGGGFIAAAELGIGNGGISSSDTQSTDEESTSLFSDDTSKEDEIDSLNKKIESLKIDNDIKERLYKEVKKYENTPISSPELSISKNYLDTMLSLPWNILTKDETNLDRVESVLNKSHYGLSDIKTRILEYIAVKKLTNEENAPILCLVGAPGVGKTSIGISIAKSLNKEFYKIHIQNSAGNSKYFIRYWCKCRKKYRKRTVLLIHCFYRIKLIFVLFKKKVEYRSSAEFTY